MRRLGYSRFVAQGGDWGSPISNDMAKQGAPELLGIHVNLPGTIPADIAKALQAGDPPPSGLAADERCAYEQLALLFGKRRAYGQMMGTRPQTFYGLADSPVDLAAWMLDHGDAYAQPAAAITSAVLGRTVNGHPAGDLTRDDVLDNVTLYGLTNTGVSSGRLYWENKANLYAAANVSIPAAVTVFPGENYQAPRSWTEQAYHKLSTSVRSTKAATSRRGNSRNSSRKRCARRSGHFANRSEHLARRRWRLREPHRPRTSREITTCPNCAELGYEVTMIKDATADYADEYMDAALDLNIPNYASAAVSTDRIVAATSVLELEDAEVHGMHAHSTARRLA